MRSSTSPQRRKTWPRLIFLRAHGADQVAHEAHGDAMDTGLVDHRRERLLGGPAGRQKGREIGTAAQLVDPKLDGAGPGLPVAIPIAVTLHQAVRAALAMHKAGDVAHLQVHQVQAGKFDHLPQEAS